MITSLEVLEKLKKGESMDDIANSITKVLNIAQQDYAKFQEEEKVRKAAEAKRDDFKELIRALDAWFKKYMPKSIMVGFVDSLSESEFNAWVEEIFEAFEAVDSIKDSFKYLDINKLFDKDKTYNNIIKVAAKQSSMPKTSSNDSLEDLVRKYINL